MENIEKNKIDQKVIEKSRELAKEKGERYATGVFIAAAAASIVLSEEDDRAVERQINDLTTGFSEQNYVDAMGILGIAFSEKGLEYNLSIFEAADMYFANPKEIEN